MDDYKHVYDTYGNLAAEQIKIFLESEGIEVLMIQESYGHTLGLTVGPLGMVQIFVPEIDFEKAAKLLEEMESGNLITPDDDMDDNPGVNPEEEIDGPIYSA